MEYEPHLAVTWSVACDHYAEFDEPPTKDQLLTQIEGRLEGQEDAYPEDIFDNLNYLISKIYNMPDHEIQDRVAFKWLKLLLEDNLFAKSRRELSTIQAPKEAATFFAEMHEQAQEIAAVSSGKLVQPFAPGWDEGAASVQIETSMVSFVDAFCDGGPAAGQTHGLLGPYGGGKTTVAVELTTESAARQYKKWYESGREESCGMSYHFTYEEPVRDLRVRALACLAKMPKSRVIEVIENGTDCLNRDPRRQEPYEQVLFGPTGSEDDETLPEYGRYIKALTVMNQCWRPVDCTGDDEDFPGRGHGLVDEIAEIVRGDQQVYRREGVTTHVALVLADYAGAAIERHLDYHGKDHGELRFMVKAWPMQMKQKVAQRFNCPVWSLHQLKAEANAGAAGRVPNITDSAEGKGWAEALDYSFMLGVKTRAGLAVWVCNKSRRSAARPPVVVRLDGAMARMRDESGAWAIDEPSKQILSMAEYRRLRGDEAANLRYTGREALGETPEALTDIHGETLQEGRATPPATSPSRGPANNAARQQRQMSTGGSSEGFTG